MYFDSETLELDKVLALLKPFCQTNKAKALVNDIKPETNLALITEMLEEVEEALISSVKLYEIPLGGFKPNKEAVVRASIGGILTAEELKDIASNLQVVSQVLRYRQELLNLKIDIKELDKYFTELTADKKIQQEIDNAITPNLEIADNATMDLLRIRKKLKMEETHLRNFMNSMLMSNASKLQENLITVRDGHFTLPVRAEHKNAIKGIVRDSSASGTTYYIEPEGAYKISADIEMIKQEEKKEINQILKNLSLLVNSIAENLLKNYESLVKLDLIFAKANYALKNNMTRPILNDRGYINIKKGAHPLIDSSVVVKNDVVLGDKYQTIIITGPNTGGKTVLLKMVGLCTLMMQSGLFVPCDEKSELNVFDNVFSDIGDEQSIEQSLSTFSSHMTNVASIVDRLTYNSLVLLDEVGSGTDPKEGASLAISIIDYLTKKGARIITTTHYSDLKAFAYNNKAIVNASVEFKAETLKPTYKLQIGVAGRSNAILISKRLGLKDEILEHASKVLEDSESDTSTLVNKIDEENEKIAKLKEEYEHIISEYNEKLDALNKEKLEIEKRYDSILTKAKNDANKILTEAKDKSKTIIEELNKLKDAKYYEEHKLAQAKYDVTNLDKIDKNNEKVFDENIKVGDTVFIKSFNKSGEVKKISGSKYEVQVGKFSMSFSKNELTLERVKVTPVKPKIERRKTTLVTRTSSASMRLDLRGYRYEEVKESVDKFLDQAYLANMTMVYIIHGFGTGAVRDAVYAYLKKCPYVKSYRYGGEGEGLNGCTVVYLK